MSYDSRMAAMEGMFDPEQTAAKMLDAVKINVEQTVKTIDAASSLENKLSEEAAQFNTCLTTMANSIRKCERGEISREEMLAECAPCVSMLKEKCTALQLGNISASGDDITESEIAMLSEYITGCKDIVAKRKLELQDDPTATESAGIMAAMEGILPPSVAGGVRGSTEAKTAKELHKQAKKLYSMGSKEKAVEYMQKAKKLYEGCLETARKNSKMYTAERTVWRGYVKDTFKTKATDSESMYYTMLYFEDRVDSCKAYLMQWANKAGNQDYKETKAKLKAERKEEHARMKAEKKANKSKEDPTMESFVSVVEQYYDEQSEMAYEAYIDFIAMEGQNLDARKIKKQYGKEARQLAKAAKRQYKSGDYAGAKASYKAASKLLDEMKADINALTPSSGSAILGGLVHSMKVMATALIASIPTAMVGGIVVGIKEIIGSLSNLMNILNKVGKGEEVTASDYNAYVRNMINIANKLQKKYNEAAAKCDKFGGNVDEAKESYFDYLHDFNAVCESYMDSLETELAMEAALEAEGEADSPASAGIASKIAAKFRSACSKLKRGDKKGAQEMQEAAEELSDAAAAAETPEEKKKLNTAAKVGLTAAAVVATAAGMYVAGKKMQTAAKNPDAKDPSAPAKLLMSFARQSDSIASKVKDTAQSNLTSRGRNEKKLAQYYEYDGTDEDERQKLQKRAIKANNKLVAKDKRRAAKNAPAAPAEKGTESWGDDSILSRLAFGLEGIGCEECDDEDGRGFDDDDMISDAVEGFEDLDDLAAEAAIAVMLAEDGYTD